MRAKHVGTIAVAGVLALILLSGCSKPQDPAGVANALVAAVNKGDSKQASQYLVASMQDGDTAATVNGYLGATLPSSFTSERAASSDATVTLTREGRIYQMHLVNSDGWLVDRILRTEALQEEETYESSPETFTVEVLSKDTEPIVLSPSVPGKRQTSIASTFINGAADGEPVRTPGKVITEAVAAHVLLGSGDPGASKELSLADGGDQKVTVSFKFRAVRGVATRTPAEYAKGTRFVPFMISPDGKVKTNKAIVNDGKPDRSELPNFRYLDIEKTVSTSWLPTSAGTFSQGDVYVFGFTVDGKPLGFAPVPVP